jgi:hypothetical protein
VNARTDSNLETAFATFAQQHVGAYSPQATGRSERAFRTLQDRLPKELRLVGIDDVEAANRWLRRKGTGRVVANIRVWGRSLHRITLLNHLVGRGQQRFRDGEAQ